jgi:hypothetical protein
LSRGRRVAIGERQCRYCDHRPFTSRIQRITHEKQAHDVNGRDYFRQTVTDWELVLLIAGMARTVTVGPRMQEICDTLGLQRRMVHRRLAKIGGFVQDAYGGYVPDPILLARVRAAVKESKK